jgi:hypothetical protein
VLVSKKPISVLAKTLASLANATPAALRLFEN